MTDEKQELINKKILGNIKKEIISRLDDTLQYIDPVGEIRAEVRNDFDKQISQNEEDLDEMHKKIFIVDEILKNVLNIYGYENTINLFMNTPKELKLKSNELLAKINESANKSNTPKRKILAMAIDDEGTTDVYVVKSKDISYVNAILDSTAYEMADDKLIENIFDSDDSELIRLIKKQTKTDSISKICNEYRVERIVRSIFENYIKDDSITVTKFSEHLVTLIDTYYDGFTWEYV